MSGADGLRPRRTRHRLDVLEVAARVLRDANRTSQALVPVVEAVARSLDCPLGEVWLIDTDGRRLSLLLDWCRDVDPYPVLRARHARTSYARGEGLVGAAWARGRAVGERASSPIRGVPTVSWAMPVRVGGSVCGVFAFHSDEGVADDGDLLAGLDAIGGQVGATLERIEAQRLAAAYELDEGRWLDATPDAVAVIDHQGRVADWNRTATRLLGYAPESIRGKDLIGTLAPARWRTRYRRALARALASRDGDESRPFEAPVIDRTGSERVLEMTFRPIPRDRRPSLVVHGRDVTEARADRIALRRARARAEDETRSRDDFLALLSHELRNPLAPIVATLELLDPNDPAGVQRAREVLTRHAGHLTRLLDDLLDAARAARGKLTVQRGPVRMAAVVELATEMVHPLVDARQQALEVAIEGDPWVVGDRARLAQVLSNLLTNASRHSRPGSPIRLSVTGDDETVCVTVRDEGDGMTRAFLAEAFEPFRQAPGATAGLGLGLALVRSLVELHQGHVHAHSDGPGKGTSIEVCLPRHADPSERPPPPSPKTEGAPRRIVIVEDDEDAAELMALALSGRGHDVRVATDGRSALSAIESDPPEVVLIDIGLPDMDGFALARALRERGHEALKLVALTGYGTEQHRRQATAAGFDHHLVKPAPVRAILEVIG